MLDPALFDQLKLRIPAHRPWAFSRSGVDLQGREVCAREIPDQVGRGKNEGAIQNAQVLSPATVGCSRTVTSPGSRVSAGQTAGAVRGGPRENASGLYATWIGPTNETRESGAVNPAIGRGCQARKPMSFKQPLTCFLWADNDKTGFGARGSYVEKI